MVTVMEMGVNLMTLETILSSEQGTSKSSLLNLRKTYHSELKSQDVIKVSYIETCHVYWVSKMFHHLPIFMLLIIFQS